MGNEAIARGALEGGVSYCTGYPGNPSSEIVDSLFPLREKYGFEVEWSVNEIVALEAAAAFSFSGLRSMTTMKINGINVCSDYLTAISLYDLKGGLLLVVCDDPGPLTSSDEEDSRHFAKVAQVPLFEPSTAQEAKEMTKWSLEFSEAMGIPCMLRSVGRLSHGRGAVTLGPIPKRKVKPFFDIRKSFVATPHLVTQNHERLLRKMKIIQKRFDTSPFNRYEGPPKARLVVMATGLSALAAEEAVESVQVTDDVGILKLGTTWPLPAGLIAKHLKMADQVLFVEEIDPFLEDHVKALYAEDAARLGKVRFYGKKTGDIAGNHGPGVGEMNADIVVDALRRILKKRKSTRDPYRKRAQEIASRLLTPREMSFCQGCPHRASFFAIKTALEMDGRKGFVVGDIGCYGLASGTTGFNQIKMLHCMGSGMGNVSGFSKLSSFGFDQPVVAVAGESTFFHAGIPALVNARFTEANALFVILDNSITAMTGFQVNPGSPFTQTGQPKAPVLTEDLTRGLGVKTTVIDPVADVKKAIAAVLEALEEEGAKVIVFRRACPTFEKKRHQQEQLLSPSIDPEKCTGDACGCNRFCSRVLSCPAIEYDAEENRARIWEDICTGCGLCAQVCPRGAISFREVKEGMANESE